VAILKGNYNIDISASALKDFYRRNGVKFLKVSYQYYQMLKQSPLLRYNYAVRLAELKSKNRIVVYIDQASFHLWLRKTHTWTRSSNPVKIILG